MPTSDSLKYHVFMPRITVTASHAPKSIFIRSVNVRFFRSRPSLTRYLCRERTVSRPTSRTAVNTATLPRNHSILSMLTKLLSLPVSLYYMIIFDNAAHHVCYIFRRISYTVRIMHVTENLPLFPRLSGRKVQHQVAAVTILRKGKPPLCQVLDTYISKFVLLTFKVLLLIYYIH